MPYCEVPEENLAQLGLFGFLVLHETDTHIIVRDSRGESIVVKARPFLWFEEISEAHQMGARAIVTGP